MHLPEHLKLRLVLLILQATAPALYYLALFHLRQGTLEHSIRFQIIDWMPILIIAQFIFFIFSLWLIKKKIDVIWSLFFL